jgi:prephenate dehydrogenase
MKREFTVSIIGMGRFGVLTYDKLVELNAQLGGAATFKVNAVTSRAADFLGYDIVTLDEAKQSDIIIPTVPISAFEETIKSLANGINPDAMIIDVCSVKVKPVEWMLAHLPETVQICGTHPIFGPDSVKVNNGWQNLPFVVCPVRLSLANQSLVLQLVEWLGVNGIQMTPEEHDRKMAYSLLYTHLIGRIGQEIGLTTTGIDTLGFSQLLKVQQYVVNDSWELFVDMNKYNVFASQMREQVGGALDSINLKLQQA